MVGIEWKANNKVGERGNRKEVTIPQELDLCNGLLSWV